MVKLKVNGKTAQVSSAQDTPLLWVLRDELGLMGTKYSCGIGECGACTVLLEGEAVLSCQTSLAEAAGKEVITIEGLRGPLARRLKKAWLAEDVVQCGFCQPAQVITAHELLRKTPRPTNADICEALNGVLCRCGTYPAIKKAIHRAARES
jgi:isoquinoline 1-oxidoreductase alpha subunit